MKVLHVLDHSLPEVDGYAIRSAHIVRHQTALGFEPVVLTSFRHESGDGETDVIDDLRKPGGRLRYPYCAACPSPSIPRFQVT